MESFILNFDGEIYGAPVRLSFVKRIREEKNFSSVEALVAQMGQDVSSARGVFHDLNLFS